MLFSNRSGVKRLLDIIIFVYIISNNVKVNNEYKAKGLSLTLVLGQLNTHLLIGNGGGETINVCAVLVTRQHVLMVWKFIVVTYG